MNPTFNGLGMNLGNLPELSNALFRSISAENPTGEKSKGGMSVENLENGHPARELGRGWKIRPCISLLGHSTTTLVDIEGPGAIQHIWITLDPSFWRRLVIRAYWDNEETPSIEVPLGDFFCNGWGVRSNINSAPIAVNPAGGFNSYWEMPFRKHARITVENLSPDRLDGFFYQFDYTLTDVPDTMAYFHAQFRRNNPLPYMQDHTILDGVKGKGQYVGTYMAIGVNNDGWWGEGEVKFFMDGDTEFPTYCGTGTEDYFGGAWDFEQPKGQYCPFSTAYLGLPQVILPDGLYRANMRFGMYRWHIMDPIRFNQDLRVTIQDLGWRSAFEGKGRYLPRQDDIATTAFWYQAEPHNPFPRLPDANSLEVI
jgi:hypothetical protein